MSTTTPSCIAATGAGLASTGIGAATGASGSVGAGSVTDVDLAELVRRTEQANAALMRGDVQRYRALTPIADDFTLMSPFGGEPTRGSELTDERWESVGRFFRNGTLALELVQAYRAADTAVLAIIERARVEVGGLPGQDWSLRVTLVYRREGSQWRLLHRHADPLAHGISLEHAAVLGRGVRL
jgi:ketosteroid isomerase-like protein